MKTQVSRIGGQKINIFHITKHPGHWSEHSSHQRLYFTAHNLISAEVGERVEKSNILLADAHLD